MYSLERIQTLYVVICADVIVTNMFINISLSKRKLPNCCCRIDKTPQNIMNESAQPPPPSEDIGKVPIVKRCWDYLKAGTNQASDLIVKASVFTTRLYRSSVSATGYDSHTPDHDSEAADSDDNVNTPSTGLDVTDQPLHWYQQEINRLIEERMKDSETCPWTDVAKCADIQNLWKIILKRQLATKLRSFVDKAGVYKVVKQAKDESVLTQQTPAVDAVDVASYATRYSGVWETLPLSWADALCHESFAMSLAINEQCVNTSCTSEDSINDGAFEVQALTSLNDSLLPAIRRDSRLCEQAEDELIQCIKAKIRCSPDGEIRPAEVTLDEHTFKLWKTVQLSLPRRQNLAQYLDTVPALTVCVRTDGTWIWVANNNCEKLSVHVIPALSDLLKHFNAAPGSGPTASDYQRSSGGRFDTNSNAGYGEDFGNGTGCDYTASEGRKDRLEFALTERIRTLVTSLQQPVTLGPIGGDPRVKELWKKVKAVSEYKKLSQFIADSEEFVTEQEADTDTLLVSMPHDRSLDGGATAMSQ